MKPYSTSRKTRDSFRKVTWSILSIVLGILVSPLILLLSLIVFVGMTVNLGGEIVKIIRNKPNSIMPRRYKSRLLKERLA